MIPMITQSHRVSNYSMDEISLMPVDKVYKAMQTDAEGL
jgi:Ca2+-transporting ATPase